MNRNHWIQLCPWACGQQEKSCCVYSWLLCCLTEGLWEYLSLHLLSHFSLALQPWYILASDNISESLTSSFHCCLMSTGPGLFVILRKFTLCTFCYLNLPERVSPSIVKDIVGGCSKLHCCHCTQGVCSTNWAKIRHRGRIKGRWQS